MLILQRRIGEIINIGDDIEIVFIQKKGNSIKVGIKAPKEINIWRNEVYTAIKTLALNGVGVEL